MCRPRSGVPDNVRETMRFACRYREPFMLYWHQRKLCGRGASYAAGGGTDMGDSGATFSVDQSVRVYPGTDRERRGVVVEDYGGIAGQSVEIANTRIAGPARRWAVRLDTGDLVFVDSDQLAPG